MLTIVGLELDSVEGLTSSGGVSWTDHQVQLSGIIDGDVLTITAAPTPSAADPPGPLLGLDDNGAILSIEVGDVVTLELEGNPTTGFAWESTPIDETVLTAAGKPQYRTDSDLIGSPGVFTFQFRAVAEGETRVELVYHRSWEETDPLQTYHFTVIVG